MNFEELSDFIENRMRMSHVYQPAMLIALLQNNGRLNQSEIAKELLTYDSSQIEYYTQITNNMVGKVLRNHEIVSRDKTSKDYVLNGSEGFTEAQRSLLIGRCRG